MSVVLQHLLTSLCYSVVLQTPCTEFSWRCLSCLGEPEEFLLSFNPVTTVPVSSFLMPSERQFPFWVPAVLPSSFIQKALWPCQILDLENKTVPCYQLTPCLLIFLMISLSIFLKTVVLSETSLCHQSLHAPSIGMNSLCLICVGPHFQFSQEVYFNYMISMAFLVVEYSQGTCITRIAFLHNSIDPESHYTNFFNSKKEKKKIQSNTRGFTLLRHIWLLIFGAYNLSLITQFK